jgi:hypothetical protein
MGRERDKPELAAIIGGGGGRCMCVCVCGGGECVQGALLLQRDAVEARQSSSRMHLKLDNVCSMHTTGGGTSNAAVLIHRVNSQASW